MTTDAFTLKRLCRCIQTHRSTTGTLPTAADMEKYGFSKQAIKDAVKQKLIKELYSDMTSGAVVKVYKLEEESLV